MPVPSRSKLSTCSLLFVTIFGLLLTAVAQADPTPDQKKTLKGVGTDLRRVGILVRSGDISEAATLLDEVEKTLDGLVSSGAFPKDDRYVKAYRRSIEFRRESIKEAGGAAQPSKTDDKPEMKKDSEDKPTGTMQNQGVSFVKEIAPILSQRCSGCHTGGRKSGGLSLDSYADMKQGGRTGVLLLPGNVRGSHLIQRLTVAGPQRMPKNGAPVPPAEIQTIAKWVAEGGRFDGDRETASLTTVKLGTPGTTTPEPMPKPKPTNVKINRPTGNETVSFKKDIAPFMVNICLRCHSGNAPRGGFSMETFEKMIIGGSSGSTIVPGDLDSSYLWDLAGKQDPLKMPPGQALITRSNHRNLRTWIEEGAKFDGDDPKATLRSLVPTPEQIRAAELAKMSPEEWKTFRLGQAEEMWKKVSKQEARAVEGKNVIVYGSGSQTRLEQIGKWADAQVGRLQTQFSLGSKPPWRGRLVLFVAPDRFGYEEFNFSLRRARTPENVFGHARVTASGEEAYAVVQDVGDAPSASNPGMEVNVIDQVSHAFILRAGGDFPTWVTQGTGLAFAWETNRDNPYFSALERTARDALKTVRQPEGVFRDGQFSPSLTPAVGFTLSRYLITRGKAARFGSFLEAVAEGTEIPDALKRVYRVEPRALALGYAGSVR